MSTKAKTGAESVSAPELLSRATDLLPALRERASHTEQLRRVPEESVADLLASELCRIGVPKRFGGLDVSYGLAIDVAAELGRACPSTSWCYGLWAAHAWLVGFWPLEAQEEVYGDGPDVLCSSSLNPGRSTCEPVDGVTGFPAGGSFPAGAIRPAGSWWERRTSASGTGSWCRARTSRSWTHGLCQGLRGSGSKDIAIQNAFVPKHRVLDVNAAGMSDLSAWEIHGQGQYRVPVSTLLGWDLVGPMVGIAQGMLDEFAARLSGTSGPGRTAESPSIHTRLSQASAEVDAARTVMVQDIREILRKGEVGGPFSLLERARFRRDKAFITQQCLAAVNRLFDLSGGHGLFDSVPLQRFHRDAHAVAHRDGLIMDMGGQDYGRVLLGLPPSGPI